MRGNLGHGVNRVSGGVNWVSDGVIWVTLETAARTLLDCSTPIPILVKHIVCVYYSVYLLGSTFSSVLMSGFSVAQITPSLHFEDPYFFR